MLPEYRPAYGFTIWIGATILDFIVLQHGALSLAGFIAAIAWAQGGIQLTPGEWKEP